MIKLMDIVNEVGDSSAKVLSYSKSDVEKANNEINQWFNGNFKGGWKNSSGLTNIKFKDEELGDEYELKLSTYATLGPPGSTKSFDYKRFEDIILEVLFQLPSAKRNQARIETNKGRHFRILATVIEILKNVLKSNDFITHILMVPSKVSGERNLAPEDTKRGKFYMTYIKYHIPNVTIVSSHKSKLLLKIK